MAKPVDDSADEGLRKLLAVEQRLQDLVRAAREEAASRVAAARAAREQRLASAHDAAKLAAAERLRAERLGYEKALSAIEAAHREALVAITNIADDRVDELARWALAQAIAMNGEPA